MRRERDVVELALAELAPNFESAARGGPRTVGVSVARTLGIAGPTPGGIGVTMPGARGGCACPSGRALTVGERGLGEAGVAIPDGCRCGSPVMASPAATYDDGVGER